MKKEIVAGIDLGTTKVCAVIAEREEGKKDAPDGLHQGDRGHRQ